MMHGGKDLLLSQAHPRRVARVAKQIEREVGTLLLTDRVRAPCHQQRSLPAMHRAGSGCHNK
jgi:hypothetical protein